MELNLNNLQAEESRDVIKLSAVDLFEIVSHLLNALKYVNCSKFLSAWYTNMAPDIEMSQAAEFRHFG